jgi:hypothetical protein
MFKYCGWNAQKQEPLLHVAVFVELSAYDRTAEHLQRSADDLYEAN